MFIDHIRILAKGGDGGDGAVSWRREKFVPRGGPDGGDGGNGGKVILVVDSSTDTLRQYHYDPKLIAESGKHGGKHKKTGKSGKNKIGKVPPGTVVYRTDHVTVNEAIEMERSEEGIELDPIADLVEEGQTFVLCEGGVGGEGNFKFRTATNQVPTEHTLGTPGMQGVFYLELRRIADAGLVGCPNAGKSTLLGALSHAKPKVGSYPFTTLQPMVGVVEFDGYRRCTVADIPGLIEGAHENRGLGHEFLRHITRCRVLLFVLDMAGSEGRDPIEDLEVLRKEIKEYDSDLAKFPWKVIANKMDLEGAKENLEIFRSRFPKVETIAISAETGEGLEELRRVLDQEVAPEIEKMNAELVFVYGTLRRGGSHSFRLAGAEWLGEGEISGKIFRIDWYPALLLGKEGRVKGDLYAVSPEQLRALDLFEGISSHPEEATEYHRVKTLVRLASGEEISAWVWEWIAELRNAPELPDGDWLKSEPNPS